MNVYSWMNNQGWMAPPRKEVGRSLPALESAWLYNNFSNVMKDIYIIQVQQVRNLVFTHNWRWVSSLGRTGKVNFFNISYLLISSWLKKTSGTIYNFELSRLKFDTKSLNIKSLEMDILKFLMILCLVF